MAVINQQVLLQLFFLASTKTSRRFTSFIEQAAGGRIQWKNLFDLVILYVRAFLSQYI